MNQRKKWHRPYGLRARFCISLLISGLLCGLVFSGLYLLSDTLIFSYFECSDFENAHLYQQVEDLQDYVTKQQISSLDLAKLKFWEKNQPLMLLELYADQGCIYSSFYQSEDISVGTMIERESFDQRNNVFSIQLKDTTVTAVIYSDFGYRYYIIGNAIAFAISLILFIFLFLRINRNLIHYICKLNDDVQILEGGNLEYQILVEGNDELTDLAKSMNRMRESFQEQLKTEQHLYEANKRLITEMSHDLRTPLTGLMLYTEILRTHRYETKEQLQDYLEKIDVKAHHMKLLSDHLFEYALDGTAPKQNAPISFEQALDEALSQMIGELETRNFQVNSELQWKSCLVQVKQEYIHRILENIISNIAKYAEPSAEILIETIYSEKYCGISILNTCAATPSDETSTEIGLKSIQTMMSHMDGICTVEQTESAFEITLMFPKQ